MHKKTGILLLNLGGPDSLKAVGPFLYNLFADPDIIRLPQSWLLQKPIAWAISTWRQGSVREYYRQMGGRSPILPLTEMQAMALQSRLAQDGYDTPVYIAMRYWHPFTEEAIDRILADGIEDLIILPLYPQYSHTTTGSSMNEIYRVLHRKGAAHRLNLHLIPPYYNLPKFQQAMAATIQQELEEKQWSCSTDQVHILFSAHSLPKKYVKKTRDPYPDQIWDTAKSVMANYFPKNPWELAYQSKVGTMPWLGPPTEGVLHYFAANDIENILVVPLSFVSDHLETLYEIDMLYLGLAKELNIPHCSRARALNDHPLFIEAMAELALKVLQKGSREPMHSH